MSINKAIISGNLGRAAELRTSASGFAVLSFSVAVNENRKNQQTGEWEKATTWFDCVVFGKRAETLAPMLGKGAKVAIDGKMRLSDYQDREGNKRKKLEIVVNELELMSNGGGNADTSTTSGGGYVTSGGAYASDDIPF